MCADDPLQNDIPTNAIDLFNEGNPMRFRSIALAALLVTGAVPAHAAYITESFTGTVAAVYDNNDNLLPGIPAGADVSGITLGIPVLFTYTFDPSELITFQKSNFTDVNGNREVLHPGAVTFFNDPNADYTITVGDPSAPLFTFSLATDTYPKPGQSRRYPDGYYNANGIGPFPFVAYDGSPRQEVGLEVDAMDGDTEFFSGPGDALLGYDDYAAYLFPANSDYYFGVATSFDATIATIRAQALAAGQVPEPSSWALLLLGAVGLWTMSRRRVYSGRGMALMPA